MAGEGYGSPDLGDDGDDQTADDGSGATGGDDGGGPGDEDETGGPQDPPDNTGDDGGTEGDPPGDDGGGTEGGGDDGGGDPPNVQPWAIGTDIRVSVWPDADASYLNGLVDRIQAASQQLWETSEGQHYIDKVSIRDRTQSMFGSGGLHFHIENLTDDYVQSRGGVYGYWDANMSIHLGGRFQIFTFVHEWGHVAYGLPDEYSPQCGRCMQASTAYTWCDGSSHNASSWHTPCWSIILSKLPEWKHPNTGYASSPPPINVVELTDG